MRVVLVIGTAGFLYRFADTMSYMESEKHEETAEQRRDRRMEERDIRQWLRLEALTAGSVHTPSNEHIQNILKQVEEEKR